MSRWPKVLKNRNEIDLSPGRVSYCHYWPGSALISSDYGASSNKRGFLEAGGVCELWSSGKGTSYCSVLSYCCQCCRSLSVLLCSDPPHLIVSHCPRAWLSMSSFQIRPPFFENCMDVWFGLKYRMFCFSTLVCPVESLSQVWLFQLL